jgi:hypothetical protein
MFRKIGTIEHKFSILNIFGCCSIVPEKCLTNMKPWREIVRCFFSTIAIYSNLTAIAIKHNFQNNSNLYVCTGLDVTYDRRTPSLCDPSHEREEKGERKKICII